MHKFAWAQDKHSQSRAKKEAKSLKKACVSMGNGVSQGPRKAGSCQ